MVFVDPLLPWHYAEYLTVSILWLGFRNLDHKRAIQRPSRGMMGSGSITESELWLSMLSEFILCELGDEWNIRKQQMTCRKAEEHRKICPGWNACLPVSGGLDLGPAVPLTCHVARHKVLNLSLGPSGLYLHNEKRSWFGNAPIVHSCMDLLKDFIILE